MEGFQKKTSHVHAFLENLYLEQGCSIIALIEIENAVATTYKVQSSVPLLGDHFYNFERTLNLMNVLKRERKHAPIKGCVK